jgi:hypothetical protein
MFGYLSTLSATTWAAVAAIAAALQAFVTLILVIVGGWQISAGRKQNQRWHTLEACNRYHVDPTLKDSLHKLRAAHQAGTFAGHEASFRVDVVAILNHLDSIAIGIYQGMYVEGLARDHIQVIVQLHVNEYLRNGVPKKVGIDPQNYRYLLALEARWTAISRPHFREEGWFRRWRLK